MLDPITATGLVSSLDQLAATATSIVCNMFRYYEAVRDSPKRSKELRTEMGAVNDLLNQVVDAVSSISTVSTFKAPGSFNDSVAEMKTTLEDMEKRVHPSKTEGLRRLKWPFSKEENERLLSKMERFKKILSMTLDIKTAYYLPKKNILTISYAVNEVVDHVRLEKRAKILQWLSADDYTTRHKELQRTRVKNSGKWFLESGEFIDWANGTGPDCLICSGIRLTRSISLANHK
jgi:hypothetical protein